MAIALGQQLNPAAIAKPVDGKIYDSNGNLIPVGIPEDDDSVIGPDHRPKFSMRTLEDHPTVPMEVKQAEQKFIVPFANFLAQSLGISLLDDISYMKVLDVLRQRSLFVVLNLHKVMIQDGISTHDGVILMCHKHPICVVNFKMHIASGKIGIAHVKLWDSANARYVMLGDRTGKELMTRDVASVNILNYLTREGVCRV